MLPRPVAAPGRVLLVTPDGFPLVTPTASRSLPAQPPGHSVPHSERDLDRHRDTGGTVDPLVFGTTVNAPLAESQAITTATH